MNNLKLEIHVPIVIYGEGAIIKNCHFDFTPCYYQVIPAR